MRIFLRDILTTLIMTVVIFLGLQATLQTSVLAPPSPSMEPGLEVGQWIIVNKLAYKLHEPQRGDVIVFPSPEYPQDDYIKRIIGLPGETVEIKEGVVSIHKQDGTTLTLDEPYVAQPAKRPFKGSTIPQNEYLVLGDNRNNSGDSRQGWTVPRQKIIGKAWLSTWPPSRWGLVTSYSYQGE